jgi:excisionase family DNA binding protein
MEGLAHGGQNLAYNVSEVADPIDLGRNNFRKLVQSGRLSHIRAGRRILISRIALEKFIEETEE